MLSANEVLHQGRYRVIHTSGQDGTETVYEAYDTVRNANVVLKEIILRVNKVMTTAQRENLNLVFANEAKNLTAIDHDSFLHVQDYFSEIDRQYLVMESVEGDSLADLLKKQEHPFDVTLAIDWTYELLDALNYLHSRIPPTIYREIKPQNIKISSDGKIKLLAPGLPKNGDLEDHSASNGSGAALNYMPLEQIWEDLDAASKKVIANSYDDKSERLLNQPASTSSDIFALGATLYHVLTGNQPVDALERSIEMLEGKADPLVPINKLNPAVAREISDVLMRALQLKREDRFDSAVIMRQVLKTSLLRIKEREEVEARAAEAREQVEAAREIQLARERKLAEERMLLEKKKAELEAEQKRLEEELLLAEEERLAEEARVTEKIRLEEERRIAERNELMEQKMLELEAEQKQLEEQRQLIEEQRLEEEHRIEVERRLVEEKRAEEERRLEEERLALEQRLKEEERRLEEERQFAEQKRLEEERRLEEEHRIVEQKSLEEERRLAEQKQLIELQRLEIEAEQKRQAELLAKQTALSEPTASAVTYWALLELPASAGSQADSAEAINDSADDLIDMPFKAISAEPIDPLDVSETSDQHSLLQKPDVVERVAVIEPVTVKAKEEPKAQPLAARASNAKQNFEFNGMFAAEQASSGKSWKLPTIGGGVVVLLASVFGGWALMSSGEQEQRPQPAAITLTEPAKPEPTVEVPVSTYQSNSEPVQADPSAESVTSRPVTQPVQKPKKPSPTPAKAQPTQKKPVTVEDLLKDN